jgi:hypothetical protein
LHIIDDPIGIFPTIMAPLLSISNITTTNQNQTQTYSQQLQPFTTLNLGQIQTTLFGIQNKTFNQMTREQRVLAFQNFKMFVCENVKNDNGTFLVPSEQIYNEKSMVSNETMTEIDIDCLALHDQPNKLF